MSNIAGMFSTHTQQADPELLRRLQQGGYVWQAPVGGGENQMDDLRGLSSNMPGAVYIGPDGKRYVIEPGGSRMLMDEPGDTGNQLVMDFDASGQLAPTGAYVPGQSVRDRWKAVALLGGAMLGGAVAGGVFSGTGAGVAGASSTGASSLLDYSLATAPSAQTGGVLGGTSNGVLGGAGGGITATAAPGGLSSGLAAATGTGAGIGVLNPATGAMGPTLGQIADLAPSIGSSINPNPVSPNITQGGNGFPNPNSQSPGGPRSGIPGQGGSGGQQNPWGNIFGSLLGMYNAEESRKRYDDLLGKLDSLYSVDSPYAKQMQDELERRDSAGGRGSQYGPRSVELAGKLTDSRRQALGQMGLPLAAITMSQNQMANNLNNLFTNPNGNVWDGIGDVVDTGGDIWNWFRDNVPKWFEGGG